MLVFHRRRLIPLTRIRALMLKRILLLLGETPSSIAARRYALRLARQNAAELVGLSGVDLPYIESVMPGAIGATSYRIMLKQNLTAAAAKAQARLRDVFETESRAQGIAFQLQSFEGDPTDAVQNAMGGCDFVITGHDTAFRGNTAEASSETLAKLLLVCPRPMIVCPNESPASDEVLIAYDGSVPAMRAVQLCALLGIGKDAHVHLISADPERERATRLVNGACDYLRLHGYEAEPIPIATSIDPTEVLKIEVSHRRIGMLVMGAYGRRGLRELLFGSTTNALVENPPCALFLYH